MPPLENVIVAVPSIKQPIMESPGFQKKHLSDFKFDSMALCGFGCRYCSSNEGNYLRIHRAEFAAIAERATGRRMLPVTNPELALTWPDVIEKLEAQVKRRGYLFGQNKTIVVSMLTDLFSGPPLKDGTALRALEILLERTSFRIRILTKNSIVGTSSFWLKYFADNRHRFVVGLSCGTLDTAWARRVEIGTPPPKARILATRLLQDAGVPTYGMLCPVFPDLVERGGADVLEDLVDAIRPDRCETVWAEPYNDRANWKQVQAGYDNDPPSREYQWFTAAFDRESPDYDPRRWSSYAVDLYLRLRDKARADGWMEKLKYLLYEDDILPADAARMGGLDGVLLQSKPGDDGRSQNRAIAALQVLP